MQAVHVENGAALIGQMAEVEMLRTHTYSLAGRVVGNLRRAC